MIEKAFIDLLAADVTLVALLSEFEGQPAIFSNVAPQNAELPYIVFDVEVAAGENRAAAAFDIFCDVWHRAESGVDIRQIAERIEYVCAHMRVDVDAGGRFQAIRFFYEDGFEVENTDPEIRHYVATVSARAGRKKWCEQLIKEPPALSGHLPVNTYLNAWFSGRRQATIT